MMINWDEEYAEYSHWIGLWIHRSIKAIQILPGEN